MCSTRQLRWKGPIDLSKGIAPPRILSEFLEPGAIHSKQHGAEAATRAAYLVRSDSGQTDELSN